jgi:c-di-GMP-binding flagellar brake protein YcgR
VNTQATIERTRGASERASPSPAERRRTPRFSCKGSGEVIVLGGALRFSGAVLDLSATGCRIETKVMFILERGTQVEVRLVVNRVHFRVAAGVRSNSRTRGVGLEFMNVSVRSARMIQELIAELRAKAALVENSQV